jgi:hypothetical protein
MKNTIPKLRRPVQHFLMGSIISIIDEALNNSGYFILTHDKPSSASIKMERVLLPPKKEEAKKKLPIRETEIVYQSSVTVAADTWELTHKYGICFSDREDDKETLFLRSSVLTRSTPGKEREVLQLDEKRAPELSKLERASTLAKWANLNLLARNVSCIKTLDGETSVTTTVQLKPTKFPYPPKDEVIVKATSKQYSK